jgi:ferredoxin
MADNFLPSFDMNEQKTLDKNEDGQIQVIRDDIIAKKHYISPVTDHDRAGHQEFLDRIAQMPQNAFGSMYRITDACVGCGICAKVCPKNCFSVTDQKSSWNPEGCISCMACIHACPTMAIQLNMPEKNPNARYRNEHISICEIIEANNQNRE